MNQANKARRSFLTGVTATALGIAVAPGVYLRTAEAAASSKVRWGLLVDVNKCDKGCTDCVTACHTEAGLKDNGRPATDPQWIRKVDLKDPKTGKETSLPVMCQHCAHPPCVDVCPTGASFKRPDGIVLVDRHTCIGCRYCMMACPYKARSFVHETVTNQNPDLPRGKGTVEGCTMCVHRVDTGQNPACVDACAQKTGAIIFGDLNDPKSEISKRLAAVSSTQIRADLGLDPGVRYVGL